MGASSGSIRAFITLRSGRRKGLAWLRVSAVCVADQENTRQVIVGKDEDLYSRTLRTHRVNLISVAELREPMRVGSRSGIGTLRRRL